MQLVSAKLASATLQLIAAQMNTSFRKAILFRAFFTSLALGIAGYAMAHSGATGIVKTRMDQMMEIGEAMKTIGQMIQGKIAFDAKAARIAANAVAENAKAIPDLFPHGSNKAPSEAVAAIWENWEEFKTLASEMEKDASTLSDAAGSASNAQALQPMFGQLGKTCSSCHSKFRVKK
ncbi:MAG: c-type cytochrome [Rhizobiaceae bacterium]